MFDFKQKNYTKLVLIVKRILFLEIIYIKRNTFIDFIYTFQIAYFRNNLEIFVVMFLKIGLIDLIKIYDYIFIILDEI